MRATRSVPGRGSVTSMAQSPVVLPAARAFAPASVLARGALSASCTHHGGVVACLGMAEGSGGGGRRRTTRDRRRARRR